MVSEEAVSGPTWHYNWRLIILFGTPRCTTAESLLSQKNSHESYNKNLVPFNSKEYHLKN